MKFSELATYFEKIEQTTSRLIITEVLADLFKKLHAEEIDKALYLLQGRVVPLYEKVEFGIAEKMVMKSVLVALQTDKKTLDEVYKNYGDVGKAVMHLKKQIRSFDEKDLSISEVFAQLHSLATAGGAGSQEVKMSALATLVRQLDPLAAGYLVRIPQGTMRLGFSDMTILDAFSWMVAGDKSLRPLIEHAYHVRPDLGYIGKLLKQKGKAGLALVKPTVFTPILMMRAERLSSPEEIVKKIGPSIIEAKYDGFRLQIHYKKRKGKDAEVRLYSRNLEDVSFMYPDVVEGVRKEVRADELIFEGEAIGFDSNTGTFLPFQLTSQRKRKYDIEEKAKEIPLKVFAFELLYVDGESYLQTPLQKRRKILEKQVKLTGDIHTDTILIAAEKIESDPKHIELLFDDAISQGLEGIIAKKLDGIYQPGARGWNWIKFKRSYSAKIHDTIDCLIMGYDYGKGKRAGFGIGAFLVGVRDEKEDRYVTVAKIGTGLSDEEWKELKRSTEKLQSAKKSPFYEVDKMMDCNVWVKPQIVVEIKADEITRSTVHTAGRQMKPSKSGSALEVDTPGFALRFPRLIRFRTDKRPEEVTTLQEVSKMFTQQKK